MSEALFIHGDARRLPIDPRSIDAIVTDPPYGVNWNTDHTRFSGGFSDKRITHKPIANDSVPFDPATWALFRKVVLWGANCYGGNLPMGSWLIWDKRYANGTAFLADAELAWMKGGHGAYIFAETCQGCVRPEPIQHPTQKPESVMRWCIQKLKLKPNSLILDPYCGSGSTAIAAAQEGHRFIGIDIDADYIKIARQRFLRPHKAIQRLGKIEHYPLFD